MNPEPEEDAFATTSMEVGSFEVQGADVPYKNENGVTVTDQEADYLENDSVYWGETNGTKWYSLSDNRDINGCVTVSGNVKLILPDGFTLSVDGIKVEGDNKLFIYGQDQGTGTLSTNGGSQQAGIGGSSGQAAGTIGIFGGIVNATGGSYAAGIGSGYNGAGVDSGAISINGGTVSANGGSNAAGIGGGCNGAGVNGGTISINGGQVSCTCGEGAAGIGGGEKGVGTANSGTIYITGGTVSANGGFKGGTGIGNGRDKSDTNNITLSLTADEDWLYADSYSPNVNIPQTSKDLYIYIKGAAKNDKVEVSENRMVKDLNQIAGKKLVTYETNKTDPDPGPGPGPDPKPTPTPDPTPTPTPDPTPARTGTLRPAVGQKQNASELFSQSYKKYVASPKGIVSISKKGVITGKKAGKVTITGYVKQGKKWVPGSEQVTLTIEKPSFRSKRVTGTRAGQVINAADNLTGVSSSPTRWKSSKSSVADITGSGSITTKRGGTTKITAYFGEGKKAAKFSFTLRVKIPKLSKTKATLKVGKSTRLKAKNTSLTPTWQSSNTAVATVDNTGKVTAKAPGSATITATIEGVPYTCQVTVKK